MNLIVWVQKSGRPAGHKTVSNATVTRRKAAREIGKLEPCGSNTASILPREPNGTSFVVEEIGEMSGDEGDCGHDWKAILSESGVEREQSNTTRCLEDQARVLA